jgi:hypothetical protein
MRLFYIKIFRYKTLKIRIDFHVNLPQHPLMLEISSLTGLWTRSLMAWPDGRRDTTTNVTWLQGESIFADLRQPPQNNGQFGHVTCLRDLTLADCEKLAAQQAFAGTFHTRDHAFEWLRRIDFQPPRATPDIGRLYWQDGILVEAGLKDEYIEHWHRDPLLPARPCAGLTLRDQQDGRWGCLLRTGNQFMYARGRLGTPAGATLPQAVASATSLAAAQALLDFEISFGQAGDSWRITRSTLPFRENTVLRHQSSAERLRVADRDPYGAPRPRIWEITGREGDTSILLNGNYENF